MPQDITNTNDIRDLNEQTLGLCFSTSAMHPRLCVSKAAMTHIRAVCTYFGLTEQVCFVHQRCHFLGEIRKFMENRNKDHTYTKYGYIHGVPSLRWTWSRLECSTQKKVAWRVRHDLVTAQKVTDNYVHYSRQYKNA